MPVDIQKVFSLPYVSFEDLIQIQQYGFANVKEHIVAAHAVIADLFHEKQHVYLEIGSLRMGAKELLEAHFSARSGDEQIAIIALAGITGYTPPGFRAKQTGPTSPTPAAPP